MTTDLKNILKPKEDWRDFLKESDDDSEVYEYDTGIFTRDRHGNLVPCVPHGEINPQAMWHPNEAKRRQAFIRTAKQAQLIALGTSKLVEQAVPREHRQTAFKASAFFDETRKHLTHRGPSIFRVIDLEDLGHSYISKNFLLKPSVAKDFTAFRFSKNKPKRKSKAIAFFILDVLADYGPTTFSGLSLFLLSYMFAVLTSGSPIQAIPYFVGFLFSLLALFFAISLSNMKSSNG